MRINKFKKFFAFFKGMNRDISATRLEEQELYTLQNCRVGKDGIISTRYGNSKQNTTQIAVGNGNIIAQLRNSNGYKVYVSQFLISLYAYISNTWTSIATGITNTIMNWIQFGDKLILGNGTDNVKSYGEETVYIGAGDALYYAHILYGPPIALNTNTRIEKYNIPVSGNGTRQNFVGTYGNGNDQFYYPYRSVIYGSYIYILDTDNRRIFKRLLSDYSYVSKIDISSYAGTAVGIATDGTNLYVATSNTTGDTFHRFRLSDLSLVGNMTAQSGFGFVDICTDNTNIWGLESNGTLFSISKYAMDGTGRSATNLSDTLDRYGGGITNGICYYNSNIYITTIGGKIKRFNTASPPVEQATTTIAGTETYACFANVNGLYVVTKTTLTGEWVVRKYNLTTLAVDSSVSIPLDSTNSGVLYRGITIESISGTLTSETRYLVRDIGTPNACGCSDSGNAGNPNGAYSYKLTWKIGSLESSAGPVSNSVTVSSKQISLSGIEKPSWLQNISGAKAVIYRTKTGGSIYYKVAEVNADTTTTYTDNIADASLTTQPPIVNAICPQTRYFAEYSNHIFASGFDQNPSFLYISALYSDDDWYDADAGTIRFIRVYENDGDIIKGLAEYYGSLFIFKRDSLFRLTGVFPSYSIIRVKRGVGTISHRTIQEYKRRLVWLSENGIEMLTRDEPKTLTDSRMQSVIQTINKSQEELSFAFIYKDRYYCYIPTGSNAYCDTAIIYDFITDSFCIDIGLSAISGGVFEDSSDYEIPYVCDNNGFVWRIEDDTYRNDGVPSGTVNGTATAGGANTITQSTASFYTTGSGLTGCNIYIISGTGAGQSRTILSNTSTIITVSSNWTTQPDNTSIYTIGSVDASIVSPKYNIQENIEHGFREIEIEDSGSGVVNYTEQVEARTAETFSKTMSSDYINYRYTPVAQWGKWMQLSLSQRKANDYFSHRSHTFWYKVKGEDKEG